VGNRQTYLLGCLLQFFFTLACGLSKTATQMIIFRALSGIAVSFSLPSAVSLINEMFPPGQSRNVAFATMGGAQPIGFGLGLTLSGVFTGTIGWQWGFYLAAITNLIMLALSAWQLPRNEPNAAQDIWRRLINDIDWVGAILASVSLGMLSYVLAYVTFTYNIALTQIDLLLEKSHISDLRLVLAYLSWLSHFSLPLFSGSAVRNDLVVQH
jgi:MFS family permease